MSGTYCGGCGEGDLRPDPKGRGEEPVACDLCGWKADGALLPRKWMDDDGAAPWTKRERKAAGKLFFLWIDLDSKDDDLVDAVMKTLDLRSLSIAPTTLVELEARPGEETLAALRRIPGVTRAELAP